MIRNNPCFNRRVSYNTSIDTGLDCNTVICVKLICMICSECTGVLVEIVERDEGEPRDAAEADRTHTSKK